MSETPTPEAYEAAELAVARSSLGTARHIEAAVRRHAERLDPNERRLARAVVDAVWPLAVAATRTKIAEEIASELKVLATEERRRAGQFAPHSMTRVARTCESHALRWAAYVAEKVGGLETSPPNRLDDSITAARIATGGETE